MVAVMLQPPPPPVGPLQVPAGPRDMTVVFRPPPLGAQPVPLAASASGTAALMHAYALIGLDAASAAALVIAAQTLPRRRAPLWKAESTNHVVLQTLLAGIGEKAVQKRTGPVEESKGTSASIHAALLAAAATNSDPQSTMALLAAATAAAALPKRRSSRRLPRLLLRPRLNWRSTAPPLARAVQLAAPNLRKPCLLAFRSKCRCGSVLTRRLRGQMRRSVRRWRGRPPRPLSALWPVTLGPRMLVG